MNLTPFIDALREQVGAERVITEPSTLWTYSYDYGRFKHQPDALFYAENHDEVVTAVKLCNEYQVPIVPRGSGTGTPGGAVPIQGGLVLSLEHMRGIIKIDRENRYAIVQPGVVNSQLQTALAQAGFFWAPDPSSSVACTIGGNLAYNSAGPRAVKYNTPRENTLGLQVVTGAGESFHTGVYTTKGVVGYDLTRLIIGSEGTLAVVTEATLKLTPLPETKRSLRAVYNSIDSAATAVSNIMAQSVVPCALEFMDATCVEIVRKKHPELLPSEAKALLMIEVDGLESAMDDSVNAISTAASNAGLLDVSAASNSEEEQQLWQARKALSPALREIAPKKISEDIVVPVAELAECIKQLENISHETNIPIVNFGHAGNGNIHVSLLIDSDDQTQMQQAEHCLDRIFNLVLSLKGTLSGEHGVGLEKQPFIDREVEPPALDLMRKIKQQFDPNGILNPGKLLNQG